MSKQLTEMSLDELKNQEKGQMIVCGVFIGLVLIMVVAGGIVTYQRGFTVFTVQPILFLPLIIIWYCSNNLW